MSALDQERIWTPRKVVHWCKDHLEGLPPGCRPPPLSHLCRGHQALGGEAQGLGLIPALLRTSCATTGKSLSPSEPPFLPLEVGMIVLAQLTSQRALKTKLLYK